MKRMILAGLSLLFAGIGALAQKSGSPSSISQFPFTVIISADSSKPVKHTGFFDALNSIYKLYLSDQLVSACEFDPSCSSFSRQAIRQFGPLKGIFLTTDRLTRCNGNASADIPESFTNPDNARIIDKPEYYRFKTTAQQIKDSASISEKSGKKSVLLASTLSALVPGLGKFYLKAPYQATSAMITNILLEGVAAEILVKTGDPYLSTASLLLFSSFYIGNIWGTASLAQKQRQDPYREKELMNVQKAEMEKSRPIPPRTLTLTEKKEATLKACNDKDYSRAYRLLIEIPDSVKYADHLLLNAWLETMAQQGLWEECREKMLENSDTTALIYNDIKSLPIYPPRKSPNKAFILSSVFPGLGQVYAKNTRKGIISLVLQAAGIGVAVVAFKDGLYLSGAVFGVYPFLRFYRGGKLNARIMAIKYNQHMAEKLKQQYLYVISEYMKTKF